MRGHKVKPIEESDEEKDSDEDNDEDDDAEEKEDKVVGKMTENLQKLNV